ncbi:MAG: MFS transporter, partial [Candidatus Binataceae bacterium]
MAAHRSRISTRHLAVGLAGYCTFINLYSPQAILPMLSGEFGAGPAEISTIITASTLAVAMTAPFTGAVADVLGRKRVIVTAMLVLAVPTAMVALAPTLPALVFWRFVQGLVMPPVFAVTIAYIGDEWAPSEAAAATGVYTSGASLGGFSGRFIAGIVADLAGWRAAFLVLAAMTLAGGIVIFFLLPREKKFVRSEGLIESGRQMLRHFRNSQLVATYAVGFGVLFNFIVTFTYLSFRLAAPPYGLSATWLGAIFVVYLVGSATTPLTGWALKRYGRRRFTVRVIALWLVGSIL